MATPTDSGPVWKTVAIFITCSEIDQGTWLLGVGTKMLIFSPDNVALLCYLCFRLIILIFYIQINIILNHIQWFGHLGGEK